MASKKEELLKIFQFQIIDFNRMIEEILEISLIKKMNRNKYIDTNARFIYLLSLFERFLGNFNQYLICTNKPIRDRYIQMFESLCDEEIKKLKKNKEWKSYYNRPSKMIKDYAILEKKKNGLVILRSILKDSVDFKENQLDQRLKYYYEARARRNLLAHRGREPDKIYFEDLVQSNINSKFQSKIYRRGLYSTPTNPKGFLGNNGSEELVKNNADNLVDLSITPGYLCRVCEDIIYITQCLLMDINDKDLDIDLHRFIKKGIKNKNKILLSLCYNLFARKISQYHGGRIAKLKIQDKVNFLLLYEHLVKEKIVKKKIDHKKIIDSISDDEHFSAMYLKNLLNDYFKKDKKSFYKNTKKLTSKFKNEKSNFEDWLIFQRYMRYKEFRDLFRIS